MVPTEELPLVVPLTCQLTRVLLRLTMLAEHWAVVFTFTEVGLQATVIVGVVAEDEPEPQEFKTSNAGRSVRIKREYGKRAFGAQMQLSDWNTRIPPGLNGTVFR
jgi:hypothetical protein